MQDRGYVTLTNKRMHAERIGELVTERLVEQFEDLLDYGFTAQMEGELDQIAEGDAEWHKVLNEFYGDFSGKLAVAQQLDAFAHCSVRQQWAIGNHDGRHLWQAAQ